MFRRKTPRPGLLEMSQYLADNLRRMQLLTDRYDRASTADRAALADEMEQLCRDLADNVGGPIAEGELSERLRRMRDLTLEEMRERREQAR